MDGFMYVCVIYVCIFVCVSKYMYRCMTICMYVYMCVYVCMCVCICMYVCVCTYVCMHGSVVISCLVLYLKEIIY